MSFHFKIQEWNICRTSIFSSLPMLEKLGITNSSVLPRFRVRLEKETNKFYNFTNDMREGLYAILA